MNSNRYVKSLKIFNPKKNLIVNEKFIPKGNSSDFNTLDDLEGSADEETNEMYSIKIGSAIKASLINIPNNLNKTILLSASKGGVISLIVPENKSFKIIMKIKIPGTISRTPSFKDGILYCTTKEGAVCAIFIGLTENTKNITSLAKPKILWSKKLKKGILTEPIATGKILIVASLNALYCFEAYYKNFENNSIGKTLWIHNINSAVSSPRIDSGIIYIGSEDKSLYALEYGGSKASAVWSYKSNAAIRMKPFVSKTFNQIIFGTVDGFIYSLNKSDGKYKWNYVVKAPIYSSIISTQIGGKEYLFFGADNGVFYCLDLFGKKVWSYKANGKIRTEAIIDNDKIYFGCEDNNLYGLDLKSGKEIFKYSSDGNINGTPVITEDVLFFGSTDSFIHGIGK